MIVDDHPGMRATIRELCSGSAEHFIEVGDGAGAINGYVNRKPEWVTMDIALPVIDGLEATRAILAGDPQARVIIVTQYDDDDLMAEARATGAVACLHKGNLSALPALLTTHRRNQASPPNER